MRARSVSLNQFWKSIMEKRCINGTNHIERIKILLRCIPSTIRGERRGNVPGKKSTCRALDYRRRRHFLAWIDLEEGRTERPSRHCSTVKTNKKQRGIPLRKRNPLPPFRPEPLLIGPVKPRQIQQTGRSMNIIGLVIKYRHDNHDVLC